MTDVTVVAHDVGSVGGMERVLAELILGLARLGHRVTVISRTCLLPPTPGVTFYRVRGPSRPFLAAYPWFMIAGSLVLGKRRRGIVHVTGAIVLNRVDVIGVHYCHQVGPSDPSRSNWLFRAHARMVKLMTRAGERLCFHINRPRQLVCVSEGVADEVRTHYPRLSPRVVTIHNGVDIDTFAPGAGREEALAWRRRLAIPPDALVAAFVGSEWRRKGLDPAIEALVEAPGWMLVVAGSGDERRYRELAASLGTADAVRWLGTTPDVHLVYAFADAFVLPSSYETFSLVTFEAAASGLPVLATAVSGVKELIDDGENGFTITRDPHLIAQRLRQLSADAGLRRRLGAGARRSALRFSWTQTVRRHDELYERLAAEEGTAA
jgi:UDP-glucose:(heptosyl)LPS alpha-1,3-glucosyltransferase